MTGWIKHFADGTKYYGDDLEVYSGRASWTKSPMQYLVQVDLVIDGEVRSLYGPGPYWQSDTLESIFPGGSKVTKKRIQRQNITGQWETLEYDCRTKEWSNRVTEGRI